jgi:hypothetical protein
VRGEGLGLRVYGSRQVTVYSLEFRVEGFELRVPG